MDQIRGAFQSLPGPVKLGLLAAVAIGILWFAWTSVANMFKQWEPIAMRLEGSAKADVLEYLRSQRVEYKIEDGTIYVPRDKADELRIEMAGLDLQVTQLKGLERLDSVGMGDTEKTIAAKRQLALQEEIQKSLNSLTAVDSSQVNLALPAENSFISRTEVPAKASIILKLRPNSSLTQEQVRGIQVLVANSIQGLTPPNVIIVDQYSNQLSRNGDGNEAFNLDLMNEEKKILAAVRNLLEPAVGPNGVTVSASVELNRAITRETRKDIDTSKAAEVFLSTEESEETGGSGRGGVPGTESNTGDTTAAGATGGTSSSTRSKEERRTDFPTTVTETTLPAGDVKRKTVAVVIDLKRQETVQQDGTRTVEYVSWGQETLQNWEQALKRAAGIDERPLDQGGRGDSLTLTEISFDSLHNVTQQMQVETQALEQRRMFDIFDWSDWTALVKIPLLIVIIFAIFWFVLRPVGKVVLEPILSLPSRAAAQIPEELPKTVEELEAEIEGKLEDEIDLATKEVTKGTILKKRIAELAKNEPESFTQLIRTWLNE